MTKKTYNEFLTEIRISHACRLLIEDKLTTDVICFECGFHNISNFFRHFKKMTGITPLKYKQQYRSEEHTSELQSIMRILYYVLCMTNKKKTKLIEYKAETNI